MPLSVIVPLVPDSVTCSDAPSASGSATENALPNVLEKTREPFFVMLSTPLGTVLTGASFTAVTVMFRVAAEPGPLPS